MPLIGPSALKFSGDSDGGQKGALGFQSGDLSSSPGFAPYWQCGLVPSTEILWLDLFFMKISSASFLEYSRESNMQQYKESALPTKKC